MAREIFIKITAVLGFLLGGVTGAEAELFKFVIIGDMPYNKTQAFRLENDIAPIIAAGDFPFIIHVGDFKGGGVDCTDDDLSGAFEKIMGLHSAPVFYTPGDNDWTDCDRQGLSNPVSEIARLNRLREIFFGKLPNLGHDWRSKRQKYFPENFMWRYGGVQFVTLHVVGTNNGRIEINNDDKFQAVALVEARDRSNAQWLKKAFAAAATAKALVVAMHADITRNRWSQPCNEHQTEKCDAFAAVRAQLRAGAEALGKPVLVAHGDSGPFCMDREFGGENAPKLWRLNGGGDYVMDAAIVVVRNASEPFMVYRLLTGTPLASIC